MRSSFSCTLFAALALVVACTAEPHHGAGPGDEELAYRRSLGIPDDARQVMLFSQSSHLDINWQRTFEEYQLDVVDGIVTSAIKLLENDPRAVYSMAEMGFLRGWWERHPDDHERLRALVAAGRFKLVGGGVTTPDTNLPPTESVIRDYREGLAWAAAAFGGDATYAWVPDTFGHNPLTAELFAGLGFAAFGFSRIDGGMQFPFALPKGLEDRFGETHPTPGTHGARWAEAGIMNSLWLGEGGPAVQATYMPYTYCLGESIDSFTLITLPGLPTVGNSSVAHVLERIAAYYAQIAPWDNTGYLFVPVGCDFQPPKELLGRYMDDWNRERFAATKVWALRATFEEYSRLVAFHRATLPAEAVDGNPLWTGYYATRPRMKQLSFALTSALLGHELLSVLAAKPLPEKLADWWWLQSMSNHHDWIPGTSLDRVYVDDQKLVHQAAADEARAALEARLGDELLAALPFADSAAVILNPGGVAKDVPLSVTLPRGAAPGLQVLDAAGSALPAVVRAEGDRWRVETVAAVPAAAYTSLRFVATAVTAPAPARVYVRLRDALGQPVTLPAQAVSAELIRDGLQVAALQSAGWAVTSVHDGEREYIAGRGDELVVYHDTGGLYRIGSEHPNCEYTQLSSGAAAGFALTATASTGLRGRLRFEGTLYGAPVTREIELLPTGPVRFRATVWAPEWTSIAVRFGTTVMNGAHRNGVGYGTVARAYAHHYTPSYWPETWSGLFGPAHGVVLARGETSAFAADGDGAMEMVLKRNAIEEKCSELGAGGHDDDYDTLEYAFYTGPADEAVAQMEAAHGETWRTFVAVGQGGRGSGASSDAFATVDREGVSVVAVHPHAEGGTVFRVVRWGAGIDAAQITFARRPKEIVPVDLRDRPLGAFKAAPATLTVDLKQRFVSLWVR